jgi:hypothetical protein
MAWLHGILVEQGHVAGGEPFQLQLRLPRKERIGLGAIAAKVFGRAAE